MLNEGQEETFDFSYIDADKVMFVQIFICLIIIEKQKNVNEKLLWILLMILTLDLVFNNFFMYFSFQANYPNYFDLSLKLLRPGGLIATDNTLYKVVTNKTK